MMQLNCTGQSPCSELLAGLSPQSISSGGYIRVKPTLQIADEAYSNIYACGDVADTETPCPNARSAMRQAATVAANVLSVVDGRKPERVYRHHWVDTFIKLTLGLVSGPIYSSIYTPFAGSHVSRIGRQPLSATGNPISCSRLATRTSR